MADSGTPLLGALQADLTRNQLLTQMLAAIQALSTSSVLALKEVNGAYALTSKDTVVLVGAAAGAVAATLPLASSFAGSKLYAVAKSDASVNAVTVTATAPDKISGAATKALAAQYNYALLVSYSGGWLLLSP